MFKYAIAIALAALIGSFLYAGYMHEVKKDDCKKSGGVPMYDEKKLVCVDNPIYKW